MPDCFKICVGWGLECYGRHGRWSKMFDLRAAGQLVPVGLLFRLSKFWSFLGHFCWWRQAKTEEAYLDEINGTDEIAAVRGPRAMWHSVLRQRYPTPGIIYDKVGLHLRFCWWLSADMNEIGSILINSVMFQLGDSVYNVYSDSFSKHSGGWGVCQQLEVLPPLHPPKNYRSLISIWRILPTGIIGQLGCSVMLRVWQIWTANKSNTPIFDVSQLGWDQNLRIGPQSLGILQTKLGRFYSVGPICGSNNLFRSVSREISILVKGSPLLLFTID